MAKAKVTAKSVGIEPLGSRVLIKKVEAEEKSQGGILLTSSAKEKPQIAEVVAAMIKDGDQIMLDASSTSLFVVRQIKQRNNITIITNSLEILLPTILYKSCIVIITISQQLLFSFSI